MGPLGGPPACRVMQRRFCLTLQICNPFWKKIVGFLYTILSETIIFGQKCHWSLIKARHRSLASHVATIWGSTSCLVCIRISFLLVNKLLLLPWATGLAELKEIVKLLQTKYEMLPILSQSETSNISAEPPVDGSHWFWEFPSLLDGSRWQLQSSHNHGDEEIKN